MKPLVSIVIPVHNGANYMREAIDSALAQTYPNIEIIVVNDGSNDNGATREIALSYGKKIRYFEKENGGVSTALNLGIRNMEGEYFSWLSHDDVYLPDKIQCDMDALIASGDMKAPVHGGWARYIMPDGILKEKTIVTGNYDKSYYESGILSVMLGLIDGCSVFFHKSYFEEFGLFDNSLRTTQDYAKWFEMFRKRKMLYVDKILVKNRIHSMQTGVIDKNFYMDCAGLYARMVEQIDEHDLVGLDIDLYTFLGIALIRVENCGFADAAQIVLGRLMNMEETRTGVEKRDKLKRLFCEQWGNSIYLYCMGNRGKSLIHALLMRGISIAGFSDSDAEKRNTCISGIKGMALDDIPKSATIIVTKENAEELFPVLERKGYFSLVTFDEIEQKLMETPVDKEKVFEICSI